MYIHTGKYVSGHGLLCFCYGFQQEQHEFLSNSNIHTRPNPAVTPTGQYLKGRVTLTTITRLSTKAVMTFNKLMCIDDTSYQCQVNYLAYGSVSMNLISKNISISVQVPPSKPDSISIVHTPADPLITSTKHMEYSTSPPSSSMTSKENEIVSALQTVKQNDKNEYYRIKTADYDTTSSDIRYRTTTTAQGITEGGNITVVCTGDVGKPPAKHVFQKYLNGQIVPMQDTVSATSISEMSENCSYYHTSNLTFQVTAKDNNAVIRCVVNSSMEEPDMYIETAPIKVYSHTACTTLEYSSRLANEAPSTTFRTSDSNENTAVIVVGTVCGSIILVLCVIFFGVLQNKNKTVRCLLRRNRNDRSVDYVNTIQQQDSSLYEGVGHALDVHNYEQLPRREHVYNNANFSDN